MLQKGRAFHGAIFSTQPFAPSRTHSHSTPPAVPAAACHLMTGADQTGTMAK